MAAPKDMSEAEFRQAVREAAEERALALSTEVDARIAAALVPLQDQLAQLQAAAVQSGSRFAFKAYNGQFMCAHEGGPKEPNQVVEFQSRAAVGPHEVYEITKI